jgi:hypothetical protein
METCRACGIRFKADYDGDFCPRCSYENIGVVVGSEVSVRRYEDATNLPLGSWQGVIVGATTVGFSIECDGRPYECLAWHPGGGIHQVIELASR